MLDQPPQKDKKEGVQMTMVPRVSKCNILNENGGAEGTGKGIGDVSVGCHGKALLF